MGHFVFTVIWLFQIEKYPAITYIIELLSGVRLIIDRAIIYCVNRLFFCLATAYHKDLVFAVTTLSLQYQCVNFDRICIYAEFLVYTRCDKKGGWGEGWGQQTDRRLRYSSHTFFVMHSEQLACVPSTSTFLLSNKNI